MMPTSKALSLVDIKVDGGTQPRVKLSVTTVHEYAESMTAAALFPPIDVFFDGIEHWLADGFHRYFAAKKIGRPYLTATIHIGTRRDAIVFAAGANTGHGLQRTNADKRKAVTSLLADDMNRSGTDIARHCMVSEDLVTAVKALTNRTVSERPSTVTYTTKHGTEATMKVGKIGKSKLTMPDRSKEAVAQRREAIRTMAAEGYSTRQIASTLGLSDQGCREIIKTEAIDVPADRVVGKLAKHDANRIVERMVIEAENLTADVNLIEFGGLDRERLGQWVDSLITSKKALDAFIRRLIKEQQQHGEAA